MSSELQRNVQKILSKLTTFLLTRLKHKPASYYSKTPSLCPLQKAHKTDTFHQFAMLCLRWRSVKDSGSSGWDTGFCTKNPKHFIKSYENIGVHKEDTSVNFYAVRPFTNLPMGGVTQIHKNALNKDLQLSALFARGDAMDLSRLSEKPHIFRRMTNAQRECGCVKSLSPLLMF